MAVIVNTSPGFGKHGRVPDLIAERGWELVRCDDAAKPDGGLQTFDFAVANPPFSTKSWTSGFNPEDDQYGRFEYGIPPAKNGDYAFLLHMIRSLKSTGSGVLSSPCWPKPKLTSKPMGCVFSCRASTWRKISTARSRRSMSAR